MDLWIMKMISLVIIFLVTVILGLLPIRVVAYLRGQERNVTGNEDRQRSRARTSNLLSYLNCFSGGVFLAAGLIHLLPEVIEKYNQVKQEMWETDFPFPELLVSVGFFLIMLTEHCAMSWKQHGCCDRGSHDNSHHPLPGDRQPLIHGVQTSYQNDEVRVVPTARASRGSAGGQDLMNVSDEESVEVCLQSQSFSNNYTCDNEAPHHHHPGQSHKETVQVHTIRSLILLVALSLHTVFEGLALGLENSIDAVLTLFVVLLIHKAVISFTMGLQFADTFQQTSRVLSYMLVFSIMLPIGISIGVAVTAIRQGLPGLAMSSMILQGLATGTFLYVTFFEILQKELGAEDHSVLKVLVIIFGFAAISLTKLAE